MKTTAPVFPESLNVPLIYAIVLKIYILITIFLERSTYIVLYLLFNGMKAYTL